MKLIDPQELTRLAREAIKLFPANGKITYCNFGVQHIATAFGLELNTTGDDPRTMLANEMTSHFESSPEWREIKQYADAQQLANGGALVIAANRGAPHGHVACLVPAKEMAHSGAYGERVPFVANVGPDKYHGIKHLGFAFSKANKPRLWLYDPSGRPSPISITLKPGQKLTVTQG